MKLFSIIIGLALLVSALPSYAGGIVMMGGGVPSGATYIINEGFEGTGAPTNWGETATDPNWDYTADPLVGDQSLYLPNDTEANGNKRIYATLPSTYSDLYLSAIFKVSDVFNIGSDLLAINTTDVYTRNCKIALASTGQFSVTASGGTATYSGGSRLYAGDTTYYVMIHYIAGSGSDAAECHGYLATSPPADLTGWGTAVSSTNGTATAAADRIFIGHSDDVTSTGVIVDSVKVSTSVPTY